MRWPFRASVLAAVFAWGAAAQPNTAETKATIEKMLDEAKLVTAKGAVMSAPVKGAPYSAEEINENTQMLADGNRIHHETHTMVYRDSEGRVRRETPESITIWDPVANVSYMLNTKQQVARQVGVQFVEHHDLVVSYTTSAGATAGGRGGAGAGPVATLRVAPPGGATAGSRVEKPRDPGESLGKRAIEGVIAEGARQVATIETGAIGNDRPIQITSERWYSDELQTVVLTRRNDPRTGEEVFRLAGISRAEPAAYLFQVPAGYQIIQNK